MIAIATLLALVVASLIVTRVAMLVLVATGVSHTTARFQARSAFTGAGFTTSEPKQVVDNPIRRKVIMALMLIGHIGIVASASTLIIGFSHGSAGHLGLTGIELVGGLLVLLWASRSRWLDRHLTRMIWWALQHFSRLNKVDVETLVELADRYAVCELHVRPEDWLAGHSLMELALSDEGVDVLGIVGTDQRYQPMPDAETVVPAGATLIVYGHLDLLAELDRRTAGPEDDAQHRSRPTVVAR